MEPSDFVLFRRTQIYLCDPRARCNRELADAWEWFHQTRAPRVAALVLRTCGTGDHLGDLTQEIWLRLVAILPRLVYDPARASLNDWLDAIVRRIAASRLRRRTRQPFMTQLDDASAAALVDQGVNPAVLYERDRRRRALHAALEAFRERVPDANHRVLSLRFLEGQSQEEIAKRLMLTTNEVKCRQYRTLRKLRGFLTHHAERDCLVEPLGFGN
ncbi:MAG: sigma-70 family RNA polymerase sigma factor [Isosphaeraceae bacterium]|nr:sigma-70 family RNA polymerase sigma factor [Isosphaeraceae bacterium]